MKLKIKKVYIIYKRSVYQKYILDDHDEKLRRLFKRKHFTVTAMKGIHNIHLNAVRKIQNYLTRHGIAYKTESRHVIPDLSDYDLIITAGGDGTFLRTAHFITKQPMLPVNSDPASSVGALCTIPIQHFAAKMDEVLGGKVTFKHLPLMRIRVNGKPLPIEAVNDALFTNLSPAATSRYYVKLGRGIEEHKSSGVWIATATGSTAAISGAGGEAMTYGDKRLQFATREAYQGNFHPYKLTHGYIKPGEKLILISKMMQSKIYLDGPSNSYDVHYGDEIEFSLSKKTLKVVA